MNPGLNVGIGTDHTLFALKPGKVLVHPQGSGAEAVRQRGRGVTPTNRVATAILIAQDPGPAPGFLFLAPNRHRLNVMNFVDEAIA